MATTNNFTEPPPQTHPGDYSFAGTVQYGSPQVITWSDNYSFPLNLLLWQETAALDNNEIPPHSQTLASSIMATQTSYSWDSKPTQNLSLTNLFWLGMYDALDVDGEGGPLFKSQYFNVTSSASSSSSTTAASSSSSSITQSTSSSSTGTGQLITTPATTAPATATPSASPTLKSTDHVALGAGLGAGLGGAALILAIALFFLFGRRGHKKSRKFGRPEVYQLAENDTFSR